MKSQSRRLASGVQSVKVVLIASLFAWLTIPNTGGAATYTLTDKNSVMKYDDVGTNAGLRSWVVDGIEKANQQFFWYRLSGASPEQDLTTIGAPTITQANARQLTALYSNQRFGVQVSYLLGGSFTGSNKSGFSGAARIFNYTASPLEFHFFQYTYWNLAGQVTIAPDGALFNNVRQGPFSAAFTPSADGAEAALFNATLVKLMDAAPDNLNNVLAAGPGRATWALQWNFTIPAQSSVVISSVNALVPEPSSLALIGLGLGAWLLRRRTR